MNKDDYENMDVNTSNVNDKNLYYVEKIRSKEDDSVKLNFNSFDIDDESKSNNSDIIKSVSFKDDVNKNSYMKHNRKFNKFMTVASVVVLSIVGASFIGGFGIGIGTTLAKQYIFNNSGNNNIFNDDVTGESSITFKNSGSSLISNTELLSDRNILIDIVRDVNPAVVNIVSISNRRSQFGFEYENNDSGSGIIFDKDDQNVYIVTNYHVISNANQVNVTVEDSEPVKAKLIGRQPQADLAVISISIKDLQNIGITEISVAKFGDSDKLQVGEMVLAIGNALGEGNTATLGIISAKNKEIKVENNLSLNVIQTDAAINPGNSGGPLVNMNGEVIGINTAKLSNSKIEGTGYSISSNIVLPIIADIMKSPSASTPFLGIQGVTITEELVRAYNLPVMGVFVNSVVEGSSAHKAGIKSTDIITSFNEKTVTSMENLSDLIKECKVGQKVTVKIIRQGTEPMSIDVTLDKVLSDTEF